MKTIKNILFIIAFLCSPLFVSAQTNFNIDDYRQFLINNQNLNYGDLYSGFSPSYTYYKSIESAITLDEFSYLDSVMSIYKLTEDELELLKQNHFVISERLTYACIGRALHDIYFNDLPVFITTDIILHALHVSYDKLLMDIEIDILEPQLIKFLNALYDAFPELAKKYQSNPELRQAMEDVDLYVTIAKSLSQNTKAAPQLTNAATIDAVWDAINAEQMTSMPLFSERERKIDFSQFTVRGHYTQSFWMGEERTLEAYFKTMMWLGRIDFLLTPPPENPWEPNWTEEEIRRMNLGAVLLNELVDLSGEGELLHSNDEIISFMVGESDNLTPVEISSIIDSLNISGAEAILNDSTYRIFQQALSSSVNSGQKILSNFMLMDPYGTEPDTLPVSFRLMGQRFIIDSYIFSNVVYDRIIYQGKKIWRPMPDPLDAMFVLGNDNALPLLRNELETYKYSSQLAALRYLVDTYDVGFWESSLYNVWLNAIRCLNPRNDRTGLPLFMKTVAWQQEKLNTQLASWAQLRHDNLLYAKQSYTGGTGCSFPHSYVEPYPEFYRQIGRFATKADSLFSQLHHTSTLMAFIKNYFTRLHHVMGKLEILARKELSRQDFNDEDIQFLKKMLFIEGGSGTPPYSGWFADLFYIREDAALIDYIVADVHTQPTDQNGTVVGKVLHVGVGKINLGIFLAESPSNNYQPLCFVGPVLSYYEKVTENFDRLTDERWGELVRHWDVPARPDWVNIYLADKLGNKLAQGRELPGAIYTEVPGPVTHQPQRFHIAQNFPNPFNPNTTILFTLPKSEQVLITVYDMLGKKVCTLIDEKKAAGEYSIQWSAHHLPSGIYLCRIQSGKYDQTIKMMLLR